MNSLESNMVIMNNALQCKKRTYNTEIGIGIVVCLGFLLLYRFHHHQRNKLKNNFVYTM